MKFDSRRGRALVMALMLVVVVPGYGAAQDGSHVELAGGYAVMRDYDGDATFPLGWFASAATGIAGPFALAGEATGSYKSMGGLDVEVSTNIHTFMGGPRVAWRPGRVSPYAQMLFGVARFATTFTVPGETLSDAQMHFAMAPGGGVDVPFSDRGALRVGASVRFIRSQMGTPFGDEPFTYREFQFVAGVVIR